MDTVIKKKMDNHVEVAGNLPSVVIILPIEKGSTDKGHFEMIAKWVEQEIAAKFPKERTALVIGKLKDVLANIKADSTKKSVVIHVSPVFEKVVALDIHLDEVVMVDEPFEIRDLVNNLQPADKYILLVQSAKSFRFFIGDYNKLVKIKSDVPDNIAAYNNDIAEKVEYFTDTTDRKEVLLDKFIVHIDKELDRILNLNKLPVFVIGGERMNGHFRKHTHHGKAILDYIHGNYDDASEYQLLNAVKPHLAELQHLKNNEIALQIEQAQNANKFCFGVEDVWYNAQQKMGRLLIIENGFHYPEVVYDLNESKNEKKKEADTAFVKDGIDVIIETVLENGGSVKFVDADVLKGYQHIALCLYY